MSTRLVKANEIESITTLAAKSFARVLEREKRYGSPPRGGRAWMDSVSEALEVAPEDLTWNALGQLEDDQPGSFATVWERVKQYARDELESGQRAAAVACGNDSP